MGPSAHRALAVGHVLIFVAVFTLSLGSLSGCASSGKAADQQLTVEGNIRVLGNEPFTAVVLMTASRNHYILELTDEMRRSLITPTYRRVTGRLYLGNWNGRDYATLQVSSIESVESN